MSILDEIRNLTDRLDDEAIDGSLLKDVAPMVELDLAGVPMCVEHRSDDWQHDCPQTSRYEHWTNPSRWAIVRPDDHDFDIVAEDELKRMRARFLLMNGWYYRHYWSFPHSMQQAVGWNFLRHSFGLPPSPDSQLGKLLALA
jgi:hypothetical protein